MSVLTVLHPRHKLQYFETAGWEREWIETAQALVRDEFDRTYAFMDTGIEVDEAPVSISVSCIDLYSYISGICCCL